MKKLLFLFYIISQVASAQSVELKPNTDFSGRQIKITNGFNQPGFIHITNIAGGPVIGTIIKQDGAYLQTFTNHALKFAVNNNTNESMVITTQGNVVLNNGGQFYVKTLKQKKITGLTDGFDQINNFTNDGLPNETRIAHGLTASDIISIKIVVNADVGFSVGEEYTYNPAYRIGLSYDNTNIHVWNYNFSTLIRSKPFKVLITYNSY
jgi:hypothetical protein